MHELKLEPVGIGEEHGVIAGTILRIVGGGIENPGIHCQQQLMEPVDIGAAVGMPGKMMQSRRVAIVSAKPRTLS
jgi:hypothetical protein